jgi:ribosome-binding factor A
MQQNESTRQLKVARMLQKDLAHIFNFELNNTLFAVGCMISVTKVRTSPDLAVAKVYISIFKADVTETLEILALNKGKIRKRLAEKTKGQLRIIPELLFFVDDSMDYYENIEKLLNN